MTHWKSANVFKLDACIFNVVSKVKVGGGGGGGENKKNEKKKGGVGVEYRFLYTCNRCI